MNYQETRAYMQTVGKTGSILGLAGITALMEALGNPQEKLNVIHVAGTNGKGSVCAMLASVLDEQGYRVGQFSSPAVFDDREIIQQNGRCISEKRLGEIVTKVKAACDRMIGKGMEHPTIFEVETAASYEYFWEEECDFVIVETGLGGREDATNVISHPVCSVITSISMDHQGILGNTLGEIAAQKAGIIKQGVPVILGYQKQEAQSVLLEQAEKRSAEVFFAENISAGKAEMSVTGMKCETQNYGEVCLPLTGSAQLENLPLVLKTIEILRKEGIRIDKEQVVKGLEKVKWPGRFEVIGTEPLFIIDGAHNPDAAEKLAKTIREVLLGRKITFIAGVLQDKEYKKILKQILPLGTCAFTVTPRNLRGLDAKVLQKEAKKTLEDVAACATVGEAVEQALKVTDKEGVIIAFGSLSYLKEVKDAMEESTEMQYVDKLIHATDYLKIVRRIENLEKNRIFCHHGLEHYLSVARIAYIINLEQKLNREKEFLYLCALLHDIGRAEEYETGRPHEQAGISQAAKLLEQIAYPKERAEAILKEIGAHRKEEDTLLWKADKRSRNCYFCEGKKKCNWEENKMTKKIEW